MNKRGFTLVELLAVIAILGILVIIALPNVIQLFSDVKKASFEDEVKSIYKAGEYDWLSNNLFESSEKTYASCNNCTYDKLHLDGRDNIDYYIKFNSNGKVVECYVTDGVYQYSYVGELDINNISGASKVSDLTSNIISINNNKVYSDDTLVTIEKLSKMTSITKQAAGVISVGDEYGINEEHFLVLDSNSTSTALIAKYNLNVGNKLVSGAPELMQNANAKGFQNTTTYYGSVAFSGTNYWNGKVGDGKQYPGRIGTQPYADIYDGNYDSESGTNYSVAYYVKRYVNELKKSVNFNITARIPGIMEMLEIEYNSTIYNLLDSNNFWTSSPASTEYIIAYTRAAYFDNTSTNTRYTISDTAGVRVIIIVPTSNLE